MTVEQATKTTIKCDGPCAAEVSYIDQEIAKDPAAMVDSFFRFITVQYWQNGENGEPVMTTKTYCSRPCLTAALRDYVPARSPRIIRKEMEEKMLAAASAAQTAAPQPQLPEVFPVTDGPDAVNVIPFPGGGDTVNAAQ